MNTEISTGQETVAYRIVEMKGGHPYTLFHGLSDESGGRTRGLPLHCWVKAEKKQVRDGTGPWYLSGFNVLLTLGECEKYLSRFKAPRTLAILKVMVRGDLRRKEHSRSEVWLADEMQITYDDVLEARLRQFNPGE